MHYQKRSQRYTEEKKNFYDVKIEGFPETLIDHNLQIISLFTNISFPI